MPNPSKDGAGAAGGNRGGKSSTRSNRQPATANAKLADEPNETNLEDYHFSEFFPHEELQNQRAAARRHSSTHDRILDPDLAGADASAVPCHDYNSQGSLDFADRLNMDLSFDVDSPQFDTIKSGDRKGDRSSSISHLHKQSGGLTASRRELHYSDSDTFASANASRTPDGTSSSSHRDDGRTKTNQPPLPPKSSLLQIPGASHDEDGRGQPATPIFISVTVREPSRWPILPTTMHLLVIRGDSRRATPTNDGSVTSPWLV